MAKNTCRIPSVLDEQFARQCNTYSAIIANLRGLYEVTTNDKINSIEEYTTKLIPFKNKMMQEDKQKLQGILNCSKQDILSTTYSLLKKDFTNNGEIRELINFVYMKFTEIVNGHISDINSETYKWLAEQKRLGKYISRQEIIKHIGFDTMHANLVAEIKFSYYTPARKSTYMNKLLGKMIEGGHIDTFFWLAKDEIAQREGIKYGKKMQYVVDFKNDETLEADYHIEDSIKDGWMREMDKENPYKTIGQEVRAYLGRQIMFKTRQEERRVTNKTTGERKIVYQDIRMKTKNGFTRLQNPVQLHKTLQTMLVGCRDQQHMVEIIGRAAKTDVNMKHIYQDLVADSQLRDAFYRDFHKTNCTYTKIYSTGSKVLRKLYHSVIRSNSRKLSFYHYINSITKDSNLEKTIFTDSDGDIVISGDKWNNFKEYIKKNTSGDSFTNIEVVSTYNPEKDSKESAVARLYAECKNVIDNINEALALGLTDKNIEDLIKNKIYFKSFLADIKYVVTRDTRIKSGMSINKMSDVFITRIKAMLTSANEADSTSSKSVRIDDSTYFTDIVTCKLANTIDYVRSFANDARYYLSLDSAKESQEGLEKVVKDIKAWVMDKYGCSSEYYTTKGDQIIFYNKWIDNLYNTSVESLTDFDSFIYNFTYDRAMLFDNIAAEDFSAEFDLRTFIANYFSLSNDADRGYARFPLFTTGDSLALKMITAPKMGYNRLMNEFAAVARQEIARMKVEANVAQTLKDGGFNKGKITPLADNGNEITGNFIYLTCLNNHKAELKEALDNDTFTEKCVEILKEELFNEYKNDFLDKVRTLDTFAVSDDGMAFKELSNFYSLTPSSIEFNDSANGLLMYYLNTKLAYALQYQFLGANPAAYGLSTAMQKRYKAYNAPGNNMNIHARDFNGNLYIKVDAGGNPVPEKVVYFSDMKRSALDTDPAFMEALAERFGYEALEKKGILNASKEEAIAEGQQDSRYKMYLDNDATDGQGFRTIESYRRVMGMSKQWSTAQENAYNRLQELRHAAWQRAADELGLNMNNAEDLAKAKLNAMFTVEEIDELNNLNTVFQPIKPHTSTVEKVPADLNNPNSDVLLIPVEHKYAEALIIPEMFPVGSFRKHLGVQMEANGIDLAASQQCVKVGEFGAADLRNSTAESFAEDFGKGYVHNIDYADYTIQTNVPEHINSSQLFGTQLRKHVFDAISLTSPYRFGDVESVNIHGTSREFNSDNGGRNFLKFYNALICENMNSDLTDLTRKISNVNRLSDMLTELKSNDSNSTIEDVMRFSLDNDGNFSNPISEPSGAYDIESIFTSIFKREVNKQHINGGSCVQVSDFGINGFNSDLHVHTEVGPDGKTNITYIDCAMAFDLSWTDSEGNKIPLKFSDYCLADGTLRSAEDPSRRAEDGELTKIEQDYPGILDLVAYRIPTEREYSILNLKVKRFYPKIMGAAIMVPSQYTTVAGFDFDIDKLYYFRKEFKQANKLSQTDINKVWNDIYGIKIEKDGINTSKATDIYHKLIAARDKAIDAYNAAKEASGDNTLLYAKGGEDLASLKAILQSEESEEVNISENPLNRKLHSFWEEAGLQEELGMSASEYFGQFLSNNKTKYVTFDNYDYSKDVTENSVVARNNELIKCIQSRLTDPATFNARYTPGGFTNAKRDANVLKAALFTDDFATVEEAEHFADTATKEDLEKLDKNKDVTNVLTTCDYNARNRVASKVIGIMANHNTNAVYSKAMNRLALREPIKIFGEVLQDLNSSNTGRDYMLTLAELLASSVDAVKTPVLNFLNINSYTANTAALLARLGLSTEEIGLFLNQPIIREVCEFASNSGNNSVSNAIDRIADKYKLDMKGEYSGSLINKTDLYSSLKDTNLDRNKRQENVLKAFNAISSQAQALSDFISKTKYTAANSIDNSIGGLIALVYDNKAANEKETLINKHLVMDFGNFDDKTLNEEAKELSSPIRSKEDISLEYMQTSEYKTFLDGTPFAFEQMVHDAVSAYIKKICKYFPYTTTQYRNIYDAIYNNMVSGTMDKETVDAINHQLPVFILNTRIDSPFNPDLETVGDGRNKTYYTVDFPRQLREFLTDRESLKNTDNKEAEFTTLKEKYQFLQDTSLNGVLDNELLDNLMVEEYSVQSEDYLSDDGIRFNIGIENNSHFDKDIKDGLTSAWEDLLSDRKKRVLNPQTSLAHSLFMYNFFIRGYEVGNNAFSNITPLSVKETLMVTPYMTYNMFYNGLNDGDISSINLNMFLPLFYSNNINNYKLVKNINLSISKEGNVTGVGIPNGRVISKLGQPAIIEFDGDRGGKSDYSSLTLPASKRNKSDGTRAVISAFKFNDNGNIRLFVLMPNTYTGGFEFANPQYNVRPLGAKNKYIEIPVKGIKSTVVDYSLNGLAFINENIGKDNLEEGDSFTNFKGDSYIEESTDEVWNYSEAVQQQEADNLAERAKENKKNNNWCN